VTNSGAQLASNVALATVVRAMLKCHTARSAAKNRPDNSTGHRHCRDGNASSGRPARRAASTANSQITGAATLMRQKALATGPTSDNRTSTGANPMHTPPSNGTRNGSVARATGAAPASVIANPRLEKPDHCRDRLRIAQWCTVLQALEHQHLTIDQLLVDFQGLGGGYQFIGPAMDQ